MARHRAERRREPPSLTCNRDDRQSGAHIINHRILRGLSLGHHTPAFLLCSALQKRARIQWAFAKLAISGSRSVQYAQVILSMTRRSSRFCCDVGTLFRPRPIWHRRGVPDAFSCAAAPVNTYRHLKPLEAVYRAQKGHAPALASCAGSEQRCAPERP